MLEKLKGAASAAWAFVTKSEPVVVINAVALVVATVAQEWAAELHPGDGWKAAAWAGVALLVRRFVTPASDPTPGAPV
jgi:hypothetical protein